MVPLIARAASPQALLSLRYIDRTYLRTSFSTRRLVIETTKLWPGEPRPTLRRQLPGDLVHRLAREWVMPAPPVTGPRKHTQTHIRYGLQLSASSSPFARSGSRPSP